MVVVFLCGGLGNQMFQYAFAKFLESKGFQVGLEATHFLPESKAAFVRAEKSGGGGQDVRDFELGHFAITLPVLTKSELISFYYKTDGLFWFFRIWHKCIAISHNPLRNLLKLFLPASRKSHPYAPSIIEPCLESTIDDLSIPGNARIFGYYQNTVYHAHIRPKLLADFTCALLPSNQSLKSRIESTPQATFIHVRRGDYLRLWEFVELGKAYYERAIAEIVRRVQNPHFFVFSNDIEWCKREFLALLDSSCYQGCDFTFIDNNDENDPTQELMLMRSCDHAIIANSTFSWWGAYLIENSQKCVVMPSMFLHTNHKYVENIALKDWIVVNPTWGMRQG